MKALMCLATIAMLTGCDASKEELASTKSTLASVTKERDDLKTQVTSLQQQLDGVKADLAKQKATADASSGKPEKGSMAAAKTVAKASAAPEAAKGKHTHKS